MIETTKTVTSLFLLPVLKIQKEKLKQNGFINSFIKDSDKEMHYEDCIYLLFKPPSIEKFRLFLENEYRRTKWIIEDYDYPGGYVVVVYSLDPEFKRDYEIIKRGRYSKTSKEFQAIFPQVIKVIRDDTEIDKISLQFRVFNKTEELKQYWEEKFNVAFEDSMEVWTAFDEEEETLNIEHIKNPPKKEKI